MFEETVQSETKPIRANQPHQQEVSEVGNNTYEPLEDVRNT